MYYVVHKFPNLLKTTIHLGTHAHPIVNGKCRKSFQEMKNMVVDEVYCTLTTTNLSIVLFVTKTFLFCHLFNKDGEGHVEVLRGEKLDQTLLKFALLCSLGICNLIISLKHHPNNLGFIECILTLKALYGYNYIQNNCFLGY